MKLCCVKCGSKFKPDDVRIKFCSELCKKKHVIELRKLRKKYWAKYYLKKIKSNPIKMANRRKRTVLWNSKQWAKNIIKTLDVK